MSVIDPRTRAYFRFEEPATSIRPRDAAGRMPDLGIEGALALPTVVEGAPEGFGRSFDRDQSQGLRALDGGELFLPGNLAIAVTALWDSEGASDADVYTLVQRGRGTAAEPCTFALRITVDDPLTRAVTLRLEWSTADGDPVTDVGCPFVWPQGQYLFIVATREVEDDRLVVRYHLNGEAALGDQDHTLDVGGSATAGDEFTVGCARTDAGFADFWHGVIDTVHIIDEAMAPTEAEWTWRRMTEDPAAGVDTVRRMVPEGVYSEDPESIVQRELAVEGRLFGVLRSAAMRLRYYYWPDLAWGAVLEKWEELLDLAPKPTDSIAYRQATAAAALRLVLGHSVPDLKLQFAKAFDLDPADVVIREYGTSFSRDYLADLEDGIEEPGDTAGWSVASGNLVLTGGGAADLRHLGAGLHRAPMCLYVLNAGEHARIRGTVIATTPLTAGAISGIVLGRRDTDAWVVIGWAPLSDVVGWVSSKGGVPDEEITTIGAQADSTLRLHLLVRPTGDIEVSWGADDAAAEAMEPVVISPGIGLPLWAGFGIMAPRSEPSIDTSSRFDNFATETPRGTQPLNWWAYRDELPGAPNITAARVIAQRVSPAHTFGGVTTVEELLCDDENGGVETAPILR